jgi:hypothetical protein
MPAVLLGEATLPAFFFKLRNRLADCFLLGTCLVYSSVLKMELVCCSEMLVNLYRTARLYLPISYNDNIVTRSDYRRGLDWWIDLLTTYR